MATKNYHRVIVNGFAIYRVSPKTYVSYNIAKDSWSSKMLAGNVPVEIVEKPKVIKVSGEAWGVKVTRSFMTGERPVTHTFAFKGVGPRTDWKKQRELLPNGGTITEEITKACTIPADPNHVGFDSYAYTDANRASTEKRLGHYREAITARANAKDGSGYYSFNEVMIVELR